MQTQRLRVAGGYTLPEEQKVEVGRGNYLNEDDDEHDDDDHYDDDDDDDDGGMPGASPEKGAGTRHANTAICFDVVSESGHCPRDMFKK